VASEGQTGLYGKLPAYGDFITRKLGSSFINPWDEWLQCYVSASKEQLGDGWLDIYLTSPIWRFSLSPGVIDESTWCGLIMPSVDRVGRYFPFSVVRSFSARVSPVGFMFTQQAWFQQIESYCLMALDGKVDVDQLLTNVNGVAIDIYGLYQATSHLGEPGPFVVGLATEDELSLNDSLPCLLDASLSSSLSSFSIWQTQGSELIAPLVFACQSFPPIGGISSMLDGQWQQRNWKIPFNLQS
jgi:type VI secretion system protein ImpM